MGFEVGKLDGVEAGIQVRGEIDIASVKPLEEFISGLPPNTTQVVVEASGVEFMDSTGLNLLLKLAARGDPGVVIRNPSRQVRRLLSLALPDGAPGLVVDFSSDGPGAAHRLTEMVRSALELRAAAVSCNARAAISRAEAQRLRGLRADWVDRRPPWLSDA